MLRWWLWTHGEDAPTPFAALQDTHEELLAELRAVRSAVEERPAGPAADAASPKDSPLAATSPAHATIDDLDDYDPALPASFVLTENALRAVPERLGDGLAIDPQHLEIDRYPRPVRIKKCLPVAVLRHETTGAVSEDTVWETTKRVLGTTRYADRYLSNVRELCYEWPLAADRYYPSVERARGAAQTALAACLQRRRRGDERASAEIDRLAPLLVDTGVIDTERTLQEYLATR
jgi:hypothetical protein